MGQADKRYFITGRSDEQAALDALPNAFKRTGMTFKANSAEFGDGARSPVCRFYVPGNAISGGSHFYGSSDTCAALHTVPGLVYEAFDFAANVNTANACASERARACS